MRARLSTIAVSTALLLSCNVDSTPPLISDVMLAANPNPAVPLAATLSLRTDEPTQATVRISESDGGTSWDATSSTELAMEHSLIVLGMRAGRTYSVSAIATDAAGNVSESAPSVFETPHLPREIPQPHVTVRQANRMEPGVTLFSVIRRGVDGARLEDFGALVIVDDEGDVVWYYRNDFGAARPRRLQNGNLLFVGGRHRILEIDMLGNIVQQWHAIQASEAPADSTPVDVEAFHHEVIELPSGNLLTLSAEARIIEDFPTSEHDPRADWAPSTVVGDVVVEFSREGSVVRSWSLLDTLDPHRIGRDALGGNWWSDEYSGSEESPPVRDWSHGNSVEYDPSDDSLIVSMRHQDAVVKIDRETRKLVWILGTHDHWQEPWRSHLLEPQGELEWQFHQHGASVTGDGTIVMFDNGNHRASVFQEAMPVRTSYSRAVEFAVDQEAMSVSQVWVFGGKGVGRYFSRFISDAVWLPVTGNVLITDGGRQDDSRGIASAKGSRRRWARILEVTRTNPAETVFEIALKDEPPAGFAVHSARRLPSLYP